MITRVVMVEFHPGIGATEVEKFKNGIRELAAHTPGLVRLRYGEHSETEGDAKLRQVAPSVVFGNFVSVWEFHDRAALNEFLVAPLHQALASRWRDAVKSRYVINME